MQGNQCYQLNIQVVCCIDFHHNQFRHAYHKWNREWNGIVPLTILFSLHCYWNNNYNISDNKCLYRFDLEFLFRVFAFGDKSLNVIRFLASNHNVECRSSMAIAAFARNSLRKKRKRALCIFHWEK